MRGIRLLIKRLFKPITIMIIPHDRSGPFSFKLPSIGLIMAAALALGTVAYAVRVSINAARYDQMKKRLDYYTGEFLELNDTIVALRKTQEEFDRLFGLKTRRAVLEKYKPASEGSIDFEDIKRKLNDSMKMVAGIRKYLSKEKSLYDALPDGWPVGGEITSPFGERTNPITGQPEFHGGMDIACNTGTPVRATADGIVSFAGWGHGSGNLVAIEHGHGYATFYAHNSRIVVRVGQVVKRGQIISYSGSTGYSTGPHVHYEIWKDGKRINPQPYLLGKVFFQGGSQNVFKK